MRIVFVSNYCDICNTIIKEITMGLIYKHKFIVGSITYVKIKFDLYKVFDCEDNYLGLANGVGLPVFV